MVKFTGGKFDLDMTHFHIDGFDITENDVVAMTDTEFTVDSDDDRSQVYTGTGFADSNADDVPDTGTIHGWTQNFHGELFVDWQGFDMSWEDYWAYVASGDTDAFLNDLFGGKDKFVSGKGDDVLLAYRGNDSIKGGGGDDRITGGAGRDTVNGGSGADMFVFEKVKDSSSTKFDTIGDFNPTAGDTINVHRIDADTTTVGNQDFHFIADDFFSGAAGELLVFVGKDFHRYVSGDVNGDGFGDLLIRVDGKAAIDGGDFVL